MHKDMQVFIAANVNTNHFTVEYKSEKSPHKTNPGISNTCLPPKKTRPNSDQKPTNQPRNKQKN